jgi:Ca2+-binding RTX toxin-like protein
MATAPQVVSAFDDVAPRAGAVQYGDYTNDNAPVLRVQLGDQASIGQSLTVTSDRELTSSPVTLTAQQIAQGYADVPVSGLPEGFSLLTANLQRSDGSTLMSVAAFALGVATAAPVTPSITGAQDDAGPVIGELVDGEHTDDATPTFGIFEQGLPPTPQSSPGHAPYGGPALLGGRVQLYEGGHVVGEATLGFDGVVTVTPDSLSPGRHVLTAVAVDRAGNVSAPSAPFSVFVDANAVASNQPTSGDDLLQASKGNLVVNGGPGDDTLMGASTADSLHGGPGNDSIIGGAGFNAVNGNQGQDTIIGRSTVGDWLLGGQGDDLIDARQSTGLDILNGNQGDDTLIGGAAASILRGGQGDDEIIGGAGADWISGDMGVNSLTGGAGADTFLARPGAHVDYVLDFLPGEGDRVLVFGGAHVQASQVGGDTVVRVGGAGEMILVGVTHANLPETWLVQI